MTSGLSTDILDLRHFSAPMLRAMLDAETELWRERLHWDYRASAKLLMQYLDTHALPGYVSLDAGRIMGYAFCVYEETKAVIGDVFALPGSVSAAETEAMLLRHLIEMLVHSPNVDRIESQLLLHPDGAHSRVFREADFEIYRRLYMMQDLTGDLREPSIEAPVEMELRPWRNDDLAPAARLISEAYRDHADSAINDQYRSVYGSLRFLNNIVRYPGCGVFSPYASFVVVEHPSREIVGVILGSRISPMCGHITQLCLHPAQRSRGLGRILLSMTAKQFQQHGASEISLTVTEANLPAVELYRSVGYRVAHTFNAAVWERQERLRCIG